MAFQLFNLKFFFPPPPYNRVVLLFDVREEGWVAEVVLAAGAGVLAGYPTVLPSASPSLHLLLRLL